MRIALVFPVAGILVLSACSRTTEVSSTNSNSALEQAVQSKLSSDPQIQSDGIQVSASAGKNQATLSGTVHSENERTKAVELAKAAQADLVVVDKIEVKPREVARKDYTEDMANETRAKARAAGDRISKRLEDAWIYTQVEAKLVTDSNTPARTINIDVRDGIVTLRGHVPTQSAKEDAQTLANQIDGVKRVHNLLRVQVQSAG